MARYAFVRDGGSTQRARALRLAMTDAERRLWVNLRRDRLGVRFRRQHPVGRFVVDFYAPAVRLAIEVDGGQHAYPGSGDRARTAYLNAKHVSVLRFWNTEVLGNVEGVLEAIGLVLVSLPCAASPLTPLRGGGGDANGQLAAMNLRFWPARTTA